MIKRETLKKEYALPKWFWAILAAVLIVIVSSVGYFFYWKTGWPGYLQALNECGNKPPVQAKSFIVSSYINPEDDDYRIPGKNGYRTYFCSEVKAKSAGYKHVED